MSEDLIVVKNLQKYFQSKKGLFSKTVGNVKAVDDVSFTIKKGETLGLVGESGVGNQLLGRTILRLLEPSGGSVIFNGEDIASLSKSELRKIRQDIQIIFQDPYSSLNPRMTVGSMLTEILNSTTLEIRMQSNKELTNCL